jgi:large subunit ribosomal protein L17
MDCLLLLSPWRELFWIAVGGLTFSLLGLSFALAREALWPPPRPARRPAALPAAGADELELIEGIGPEIAGLLRDHGIDTFEALAELRPGQLRFLLLKDPDFSLAQPSTWPFQARLLADGHYGDFARLNAALVAGVPRLENVDGIGDGYARRLREGGIETVAELQRSGPARIAAVFPPGDRERIAAMAPHWIDHARRLHEGDPATLSAFARLGAPAAALARADAIPARRGDPDRDGVAATHWRRESRLSAWFAPLLALALLLLLLLLALLGLIGDRGRCRVGDDFSSRQEIRVVVEASAAWRAGLLPGPWPPGPWPGGPCPAPAPGQACPISQPCCPACARRACPDPTPEPRPCGCDAAAAPHQPQEPDPD